MIAVAWLVGTATPAAGSLLNGREVAMNMYAVGKGVDCRSKVTMTIDRRGQVMVRKLAVYAKPTDVGERRMFEFLEPASVRDTKYLVWSYRDEDRDDDTWVFLPSESLVRRISGGGRKGAFMRSDLAVEDLEKRYLEDDAHVLTGSGNLDGYDCHVLEMTSTHPEDSNYRKRVFWIRKDIWLPVQTDFYDHHGVLVKTARYERFEKIQGIWTITRVSVESPARKSKTVMEYDEIVYDTGLDDAFFDRFNMKR
jgi:hypothetical protein